MTTPQPGPNTDVTQPVTVREVAPPPSLAGGRHAAPGGGFYTKSAAAINAMESAAGDDITLALHKAALFGESISASLQTAMEAAKEITKQHEHQAKHAKDAAASSAQMAQHTKRAADEIKGAAAGLTSTPGRTDLPGGMPTPVAPPAGMPPAGMNVVMPATFNPNDDPESQYMQGGWNAGRQFWQRGRGSSSQPVMMAARRMRDYVASKSFGAPPLEQRDGKWYNTDENRLASAEEITKFSSRNAMQSNITGALNNVAHGEGITSVLGGASKFLGYAGAAYTAVQMGAQFAEDQRAKNAQFQSIYGGSNAGAFGQRAEGGLFRWSQFGSMSGAQANQLFMGVSQTGLQGDQRQSALDFAVHEFRNRGLDIATSLDLINTAAKNGVDNFNLLSDSISQISDAASKGGRNIGETIQQYAQVFGQLAPTLGGTAAATVAGNLTAVSAALPRELSGVNLAGLGSSSTLRILAAQNGMSYSQLLGMSQQAGGTDRLAQMQQQFFNQRLTQSMSPDVMQAIQQRIRSSAQGGVLTAGEAQGIGAWALQNGLNVDQAMAMAQSAGISGVTAGNVGQYVTEAIATGGLGISTQANKNEALRQRIAAEDTSTIGGHAIYSHDELAKHHMLDAAKGRTSGFLGGAVVHLNQQEIDLANQLGIDRKDYISQSGHGGTEAHDIHNYQDLYVEKQGRRSKVIESLLANYDPSRRFTVQTKDGQRSVDLKDAMKYYSDQLIQGDVQINAGQGAGQTVGQFTGLADPSRKTYGDKAAAHGDKIKAGDGSGSVKIEPSAELMRLFNFSATGGAYIDTARQSGVPATAFPPTNDLPSGG